MTETTPDASRLRVLVLGSSVGYYVRPPAAGPGEAAFDELLERGLRARGIDAEVRNDSRWFETVVDGYRRLPDLLTWYRPDVIVTMYGYIESQPRVCPRWFATWLFTWKPRTDRLSRRVRAIVAPRAARVFHAVAPRLAARPRLPSRVPPDRVQAEHRRLIGLAAKERGTRVLCANVPASTDRIEATLPSTRRRIAATSAAIARAVADAGDAAEVVDLRGLVAEGDTAQLLPDGIHLSAVGHRVLAEHLTDRLLAWRRAAPTPPAQ